MSTKFVHSDATETGLTWEILVATKKRKLESTSTNPSDTESKNKNSMYSQEGIGDLYRYNSPLDPALGVCDLDSFATNPGIFDNGEN